jgi:tetratricopeptide (TPR) repeat protein
MLYLIIPPVVIIVSLALLLFLLSRRMPEVAKMEMQFNTGKISGENLVKGERFFSFSKLSLTFLYFIEKVTLLFKVLLLKFYNLFNKWSHFAKEKRKKNGHVKNQNFPEQPGKEEIAEDFFVKKIEEKKINEDQKTIAVSFSEEETVEKESQPMVSKVATQPEFFVASKNKFEEILIERIATDPRDLEAYERLGDYYIERKDYQDAKECYKQVLKLSPVNRKARIKMRKLERILGR